jgi:hypothetical protein
MSFSLLVITAAVAGIAISAWVLFYEYPRSAIERTRNELFSLRDELFDLGQKGEIPFDSDAYTILRGLLNGMIRYAHDISGTQLIATQLIRSKSATQYSEQIKSRWKKAQSALPAKSRSEAGRIMSRATDAMFGLIVGRSVLLSTLLSVIIIALIAIHALKSATKRLHNTLITTESVNRQSQYKQAFGEILNQAPIRKVRPIIRAEASRYTPRDNDIFERCIAA